MKMSIGRNRKKLLVVLALGICCVPGCGTEKSDVVEDVTEENLQIQIRNLEGIVLEDEESKLPYNITMYDSATEAFENPIRIHLNEEGKINFSSTKSEDFSVQGVYNGIVIEENQEYTGCSDYQVTKVGDISTFSLMLPDIKKQATIVYQIDNGEHMGKEYDKYMAFYIIPQEK